MRVIEADITAIKKIWKKYTSACETGDLDLWISLWTDNGVQMPPDAPARVGKEQIREKMSPLFDQFNIKIPINIKEIRVSGDLAFSRGTYMLSTTPKTRGAATKLSGKYLTILEKQADSTWKIAIDCFNYNAPPTSAPS